MRKYSSQVPEKNLCVDKVNIVLHKSKRHLKNVEILTVTNTWYLILCTIDIK